MLVLGAFVDVERAQATSVIGCDPITLAQSDRVRVGTLARDAVAPRQLDETKAVYCKRGYSNIALFQTVPVFAADGALETAFTTCRRGKDWKCDTSVERAVDLVEADGSTTVRITTRADLSADRLRDVYAAALELAGRDSPMEPGICATPGDLARKLRSSFVQSRPGTIKVSRDGTSFNVERDHVEIKLSIEERANGVKTMHLLCVTRFPS